MSTHTERVQWRRSKVMELSSQGNTQTAISKILQVAIGTVNKDLSILRQQARVSIQQYNERLPHEYDKCMIALTEILKQSFDISHEPEIKRHERLQALSLIKEIISTKIELLSNTGVVDEVVKWIDNYKQKQNVKNTTNNNKDKNSKTNSDTENGKEQEEQQIQSIEFQEQNNNENHEDTEGIADREETEIEVAADNELPVF